MYTDAKTASQESLLDGVGAGQRGEIVWAAGELSEQALKRMQLLH